MSSLEDGPRTYTARDLRLHRRAIYLLVVLLEISITINIILAIR